MTIKNFDSSLIIPAAVPGGILTAAWLTIFIHNSGSFTLNTADAFLLAGIVWAAVSLLIFILLYAVSFFSWHKWIMAGLLGISCDIILQYHLGAEVFRTDIYFSEITADTLLILSCHVLLLVLPIAAVIWQKERCYKWRIRISLILLLMQIVTLIHCVFAVPVTGSSYDFKEYSFSEKGKFSFGSKENIIILVVDCMGERILKEVLSRYPELQESFRDFTCFDRMTSPLPRTMYAVPALLTGIDFPGAEKGVPEEDDHGLFLSRVCREKNSLLQLARTNGFRVEGYPFILQTISYVPEVIDNSEVMSEEVRKESVLKILEVVQERLVPSFVKPLLYDEEENGTLPFVRQGVTEGSGGLSYDQNFYRRLNDEFRIGSYKKIFKYLHIHGAHDPVMTDENLLTRRNALKHQQLRGSLKIVELLFKKLKEHGIYDSSTIVITGDHTERYTPEIAAFIKRPFERKKSLVFNSVPCSISQISACTAKSANLDPRASSLFDLAFIPGSIKDVRDTSRKFPEFTNWKKLERSRNIFPEGTVQGICLQRGKRIMIELAGENTLQLADKVTVTAENILTAEQYGTSLIKKSKFRDILLPEMAFPDGDYLLTITESGFPAETNLSEVSRIIPGWIRVKKGEISVLSRIPDLFHETVRLDTEMTFHPFAGWPGVRFSPGCETRWGNVVIPEKETVQLRLPKLSGVYRAEISCSPFSFEKRDISVKVNGRVNTQWGVSGQEKKLFSVDIVPGKEGIAEISLEYRREKKRRRRTDARFVNHIRIFSITVRKSVR